MPAPGYASILDIKDEIVNVPAGSGTNFTDAFIMRMKSKITGEIDSALESAGYEAPTVATITSTTDNVEAVSADTEDIEVSDASEFASALTDGKTLVRVYGLSADTFNDEFTEMVSVTGNTIKVLALANAYDAGATVELVAGGFRHLRNVEAKGAAARALNSQDIRSRTRNEKVDEMIGWYNDCLKAIRDGIARLDGFTLRTGAILSWQTENSSDADVSTSPVVNLTDPH